MQNLIKRQLIESIAACALLNCVTLPPVYASEGLADVSIDQVSAATVAQDSSSVLPVKLGDEKRNEFIEVMDADGQKANRLVAVFGGRHARFTMPDDLVANPINNADLRSLQILDGVLPLKFRDGEEFVALWSESGYCKHTVSELRKLPRTQLQKWCSVEVHIKMESEPTSAVSLVVANTLTSSALYQGFSVQRNATVDAQGIAKITKLPPGENRLSISDTWSTYLYFEPGEHRVYTLGGGCKIYGRFVVPDPSTMSLLMARGFHIRSISPTQSMNLNVKVLPDGSFESDSLPNGKYVLRAGPFTNRAAKGALRAVREFECDSNKNPELFLGEIFLDSSPPESSTPPSPNNTLNSKDDFVPSKPVAFVSTVKNEDKLHYALLDNAGLQLRIITEFEVPAIWATAAHYAAIDFKRGRVYLNASPVTNPARRVLLTLDIDGRKLSERYLPEGKEFRISVDQSNGNVWVLAAATEIEVIDLQGKQIATYPNTGFNLAYSSFDLAMWTAGPKEITKFNPNTGESIASFHLPKGIWNVVQLFPKLDGGVLAIEQNHPDLPHSANRIWSLDAQAQLIAAADLGSMIVLSLATKNDEVWITGTRNKGLWSSNRSGTAVSMVLNRLLEQLERPLLESAFVTNSIDGQQVIGFHKNGLGRVSNVKPDGTIVWEELSGLQTGVLWTGN